MVFVFTWLSWWTLACGAPKSWHLDYFQQLIGCRWDGYWITQCHTQFNSYYAILPTLISLQVGRPGLVVSL